MEFRLVYIREAHPTDGWQIRPNIGSVEIPDPATSEARGEAANSCVRGLGLTIPAVIDGLDDAVNRAYVAWPERLFVVGTDGKVAYAGGMGPFLFDVGAWERAIDAVALGRE